MKKRKMMIVMAIMLLCTMTMLASCGSKVNAFDHLTVSFDGYNGNGTVSFSGEELLVEAVVGSEPEDFDKIGEWLFNYDNLYGNIHVECNPSNGLSNGDTVTVTVAVTGNGAKEIAGGKKEFEVSGLSDVQSVDLFADVEVEFTGIIGKYTNANVKRLSDDEVLNACSFKIEPSNDIQNGDVVTVTIANGDYLAENYLVVPAELSKTFTVSGLDEYLTDADLLPEDQIREIIDQYVPASQNKDYDFLTYGESVYYKTYFCIGDKGAFGADINRLLIVTCCDEYMNGSYWRTTYVPLIFRNLILAADGTMDLNYEDGRTAVFYTDPDRMVESLEAEYTVEEVYIEYE